MRRNLKDINSIMIVSTESGPAVTHKEVYSFYKENGIEYPSFHYLIGPRGGQWCMCKHETYKRWQGSILIGLIGEYKFSIKQLNRLLELCNSLRNSYRIATIETSGLFNKLPPFSTEICDINYLLGIFGEVDDN